jgi:tetratricopeptide (TPR) repeat protein
MTEPETSQTVAEKETINAALTTETVPPEQEAEADAPPEPWTPERVSEWNAYYDIYVILAALLLTFTVSCNFVTDSHVWLHIKTGELIAAQTAPVMTDSFSYTKSGQSWVNIPWLYQWGHAALYNLVYGLVPVDPRDPTANKASAEQVGIGALVVLSALARLATAWLLLRIRHRGPGLWWSALCVVLAFGVVYHPVYLFLMGGIAGSAAVAPFTWAQLLFAFELLVLFRAFSQGRAGSLWLLVPTFALWANIDESFHVGLIVLAAAAVGRLFDGKKAASLISNSEAPKKTDESTEAEVAVDRKPAGVPIAFLVFGLCAAACLANPYTYRVYTAALDPYVQLFQPKDSFTTADQLSFFGEGIKTPEVFIDILGVPIVHWKLIVAYYVIVVALGLGSFLLNARRFSWSRFLPFVALAVFWGILIRFNLFFGLIFAATIAINGQEWYHDRVGTEGRLGWRWTFWSTGGRLVTLALIFLMVGKDITGNDIRVPGINFGVGFHEDNFPFEAAAFLAEHKEIKGNVLNTSKTQGDILIWKAGPERKTYVDGRFHLFPQDLLEEWRETRKALSSDDKTVWKPLLDKYDISVIMIETGAALKTYRQLMTSANWIPFHDDGNIVMFGRSDAAESDKAVFNANRLDPDLRAYHTNHPVTGAERPPNPTTWIDDVFQTRTNSRPQSRTESSRRWLIGAQGEGESDVDAADILPSPARCLLAIQEARIALSHSPDDWIAFRMLKEAYRLLMIQEAAMLAGIPITPANYNRIRMASPNPDLLITRVRQRMTALNYAIQTTPPPKNDQSRRDLESLNLELYTLYKNSSFLDLARDRLQLVLETSHTDDFLPDAHARLERELAELNQWYEATKEKLDDLQIERQAGPIEQAAFALNQGATNRAIELLADAERSSVSLAVVKPRLVDLYSNSGQPDKALELLAVGAIDDPNLGSEPGMAALRQGRVYFLLGNYFSAATLWRDRAVPRVRFERSHSVLFAGQGLVRGEAVRATSGFLGIPGTISQQAVWEYDLAMCQLEAGSPDDAAEHFTKSLTLFPELQFRPIAAYYLERMGKPVPPPPKTPARTAGSPTPDLDKPLMQSPLPPSGASPPASASGKADSPKTSPKPAEPAKSTPPGKAVSKEPASKGTANP